MQFDSDVALIGTGVAALVAANQLMLEGKSVLLLNPDLDFFLEDSELPLDPFLHHLPSADHLDLSSPQQALEILRPDFPGPIEFWAPHSETQGFHDPMAPHVRSRDRIWIASKGHSTPWPSPWEDLENLYVESLDRGLNPKLLEGIAATHRFPGLHNPSENFNGLLIPKLVDVDLIRYRSGLLEFVQERMASEKLMRRASQIEWMPEGIRFHSQGTLNTAKIKEGILVFWTPHLSSWVLQQAKRAELTPVLPSGLRIWQQWGLTTNEPLDSTYVANVEGQLLWADFEGPPASAPRQLTVLQAGPLTSLNEFMLSKGGIPHSVHSASSSSFTALSKLCHGLLKWDSFFIQSLRSKAIFEWQNEKPWFLSKTNPFIRVVPASDGPLINVVRVAREACSTLGEP